MGGFAKTVYAKIVNSKLPKETKVYNDNGYQVYTVWSDDFVKNKEKTIKDFCKYVRDKG